ncbi:MAG: hypothetical protein EOO42_01200 [Flavobacteriales bacterium]|nr:MAG: hypothetical protein EOO42_01200 [Flavobacteriales bacterium]
MGILNKPVISSGGGFVVERTFYINFTNEFATPPTESGYTWNTFQPTGSQLSTPGSAVLSNIKTETNAASTVSLTNLTAFDGNTAGAANYTQSPPVYPVLAVNGAFQFTSTSTLRISGLTDGKYYHFSFLPVSGDSNANTTVTIGGTTVSKLATNNYPPTGSDRLTNSNLATIINKQSTSGIIDITFDRTGFYVAPINLMFFQESGTIKS